MAALLVLGLTVTDILDTIDNAIADCELSADAMRWNPDPQPATGGHLLASSDIARLFGMPHGFLAAAAWVHVECDRTAQDADDPMLWLRAQIAAATRRSHIRRAYRAKRRGWRRS